MIMMIYLWEMYPKILKNIFIFTSFIKNKVYLQYSLLHSTLNCFTYPTCSPCPLWIALSVFFHVFVCLYVNSLCVSLNCSSCTHLCFEYCVHPSCRPSHFYWCLSILGRFVSVCSEEIVIGDKYNIFSKTSLLVTLFILI